MFSAGSQTSRINMNKKDKCVFMTLKNSIKPLCMHDIGTADFLNRCHAPETIKTDRLFSFKVYLQK